MKRLLTVLIAICMMVTILPVLVNAQRFSDVPSSHPHFAAIEQVTVWQQGNISQPILPPPLPTFLPNANIPRAEVANLISQTLRFWVDYPTPPIPFTDIDWQNEHYGVYALWQAGIIANAPTFRPNANTTFIEMVEWIVNTFGFQSDAIAAGGSPNGYRTVAQNRGFLTNLNITNNNQVLTRGQAYQMLYNAINWRINNSWETSPDITVDFPVRPPQGGGGTGPGPGPGWGPGISFPNSPINIDDTILAPINLVAPTRIAVQWCDDMRILSFDDYVFLELNSRTATFADGRTLLMPQPLMRSVHTYVFPFAWVMNLFGYDTVFNQQANTITLTTQIPTAGTVIQGLDRILLADTTWNLAGSPYLVKQAVFVDYDVTLTIEPGVEIIFFPETYMQVRGNVRAIGTAQNRISFSGLAESRAWDGIQFRDDNNVLEFCDITERLTFGWNSNNNRIENSTLTEVHFAGSSNNRIENNSLIGIDFTDGSQNIVRSNIINGGMREWNWSPTIGIRVRWSQHIEIVDNTIINTDTGIFVSGYNLNIRGNTIKQNDVGISAAVGRGQIEHNNIVDNRIGIQVSGGTPYVENNSILNNTEFNVVNGVSGHMRNFTNNYWGTTNRAEIAASIYDFWHNPTNRGRVYFEPFLTSPPEDWGNVAARYVYRINSVNGYISQNHWGGISVYVNLTKNQQSNGGMIILAFFDDNGRFIGNYRDDTFLNDLEVGQMTTFSWYYSQPPTGQPLISEIRIFIWCGMNLMTPLSNMKFL